MNLLQGIHLSEIQFKNIIFDWGGVITNIDPGKSADAFLKLGFSDFDNHYGIAEQIKFYRWFEEGKMTASEFRNKLREYIPKKVSNEEIDLAWSAMLLDTPRERWELLGKLKQKFRTFLLSNTSSIHVERYFDYLYQQYGVRGYKHLFEKVYFSYELGIRKPDLRVFEFILKDNRLIPAETLYIDDVLKNVEAAKSVGMLTYHLQLPDTLTDIFKDGKD